MNGGFAGFLQTSYRIFWIQLRFGKRAIAFTIPAALSRLWRCIIVLAESYLRNQP